MSREINKSCSARAYGLFDGDNSIGFLSALYFPHPTNRKIYRCHRLVVLPEYQGLGIGGMFATEIAKIYKQDGFDFGLTTSAKNFAKTMTRRKDWALIRYGVSNAAMQTNVIRKSRRCVPTYSFYYVGNKEAK